MSTLMNCVYYISVLYENCWLQTGLLLGESLHSLQATHIEANYHLSPRRQSHTNTLHFLRAAHTFSEKHYKNSSQNCRFMLKHGQQKVQTVQIAAMFQLVSLENPVIGTVCGRLVTAQRKNECFHTSPSRDVFGAVLAPAKWVLWGINRQLQHVCKPILLCLHLWLLVVKCCLWL